MNDVFSPDNPLLDGPGPSEPGAVVPSAGDGGSGVAVVSGAARRGAVRRGAVGRVDPFGLRMLVITWCLWLLVSWSITLAIGATVHAVRWVVFSAVFGLMAVWPALRLSQQLPWRHHGGRGGRPHVARSAGALGRHELSASPSMRVLGTLLDWVCLVSVFQVVVWPLMLVGRWSAQQTLWLDLTVASWSLLTGVLVGLGRVLPMNGSRVGAMVLCVLLFLGEPVLMALGGVGFLDPASGGLSGGGAWRMRISPIQALWELTTTVQPYDPSGWVPAIVSTAAAAGLGWLVLWVMAWRVRGGSGVGPGGSGESGVACDARA